MERLKLILPLLILLFPGIYAATYYIQIVNPNDYDLTDYQVLDYTTSGLVIQTGSDGKVLIVNK